MSSNRSNNRLSAPTPSKSTTPFEPSWRSEPSAASKAVWANDLLVETIYRHVYQQGYMKDLDDPKGLGDMINGMLLCKSRFWIIARIRWEKSWLNELLCHLKLGASLDRFVAICRSVKVLCEDDEVFRRNIRESGFAVTPQYLYRYSSLLANLKIIRTWTSVMTDATVDATVCSFLCDGQRILVEELYPSTIPSTWKCNHAPAGGTTCCYSLHSVQIMGHSSSPLLADSLKALIAETQGVSKEIALAGPLGQLRSLTFLPTGDPHGTFSLSELDGLFDACPELCLLACRLEGSSATIANEETLDRIFAKGNHIERISIDTPGDLVPYLRCLSRFQYVTLACEFRLRESDMAMLESRVGKVLPCIPQTKSFTVASTGESLDFLFYAKQPALPVAQVIQLLLPPDCRVTAERLSEEVPERYTQPMVDWWGELSTTLQEFEKAKLEARSSVRSFVPMTPEQIAKVLQLNGG